MNEQDDDTCWAGADVSMVGYDSLASLSDASGIVVSGTVELLDADVRLPQTSDMELGYSFYTLDIDEVFGGPDDLPGSVTYVHLTHDSGCVLFGRGPNPEHGDYGVFMLNEEAELLGPQHYIPSSPQATILASYTGRRSADLPDSSADHRDTNGDKADLDYYSEGHDPIHEELQALGTIENVKSHLRRTE